MSFNFVIAWEQEVFYQEKIDKDLEHLLLGLHKYNVEVFLIPAEYGAERSLAEILEESGLNPKNGLLLAASDTSLFLAKELPIATVAFFNPGITGQTYENAQILVEGFEEVDFYFLERIYNRKHGIPWRVIDTERCYLREMTLADLDGLYELYAGKDMTKYMEPLYADRNEEYEYAKAYIDNQYYYYGYGMWLVFEQATEKLIGRAGLDNREIDGKVELEMGYAIAADRHRQGYGTEVCLGIIRYAREFLDFPRLNCFVERGNEASAHLLLKLGFSWVEERKLEGKQMQRFCLEF